MTANQIAWKIFQLVGGKENVINNTMCMTRLRLVLKKREENMLIELKKVEGILGVVEASNGYQIVLGPGIVSDVAKAFSDLSKIPLTGVDVDVSALAEHNKMASKTKFSGGGVDYCNAS